MVKKLPMLRAQRSSRRHVGDFRGRCGGDVGQYAMVLVEQPGRWIRHVRDDLLDGIAVKKDPRNARPDASNPFQLRDAATGKFDEDAVVRCCRGYASALTTARKNTE